MFSQTESMSVASLSLKSNLSICIYNTCTNSIKHTIHQLHKKVTIQLCFLYIIYNEWCYFISLYPLRINCLQWCAGLHEDPHANKSLRRISPKSIRMILRNCSVPVCFHYFCTFFFWYFTSNLSHEFHCNYVSSPRYEKILYCTCISQERTVAVQDINVIGVFPHSTCSECLLYIYLK